MGRPHKADDDRRTETIAFRCTPAERLQIETHAAGAGIVASEYARMQALRGRVVVQQTRQLDHDALDQIRRIGVNLNQLARIANATGRVPSVLPRLCGIVERILAREFGAADDPRDSDDLNPPAPSPLEVPPPDGPERSEGAESAGALSEAKKT